MVAPSNLGDGQLLGRSQARRMSRRFADVGVEISPARLRSIAAGTTATSDEWADVQFALVATATRREQRRTRVSRAKHRAVHGLVVVLLVLTALNLLASTVYIMLSLLLHQSPF